ncbi:MAG: response regulator [Phycisphaerales bacterium]
MAAGACSGKVASQSQLFARRTDKQDVRLTRVLVADDEHLVAAGISSSLTGLGYTVLGPVGDGLDAIQLCRRDPPDLALLDIRMPNGNGLEAAAVVLRDFRVPVVLLSAYSDPEYLSTAAQAGVFGFLLKPVSQDQIRVCLEIAWGRFQAHLRQHEEISSLKRRLEDRKTIEQAKWLVVKHKQVSEPQAMKLLQKQARDTRRPLVDIARSILENMTLLVAE